MELALGLLVFVTVLIVGIHFAELGYLSLRVQQAAISPLWDATSLRVHQMRDDAAPAQVGDFSAFNAVPTNVELNAQRRFADFDGRASTNGATQVQQLYTRLDQLQQFCRRDDRVYFDLPRGSGPTLLQATPGGGLPTSEPGSGARGANASVLGRVFENVGGMACTAGARISGVNLPKSFMEGDGGFFREPHPALTQMRVCGAGPAISGTCPGRFALLLGDWGYSGVRESGHCPLQPDRPNQPCAENRAFYNAARYVFEDNEAWAGRAASDFAITFAGIDPMPEQGFFMSYRGLEDGYVETATPPGEPDDMAYRPYNTGGVSHRPPAVRGSCFLGRDGC